MKLAILDEYRSTDFTHYDTTMQPIILQHFQDCRLGNRFIDLEVEVEGVTFPCHKIILDAFCPYFAAHFSFNERSEGISLEAGSGGGKEMDRVVLKYKPITPQGFARLLDFMYTAELKVMADEVIDVLQCADFLQFEQVVYLCSAFLQQHMAVDTCLQVLVLAQTHDLQDLAARAFNFILQNLAEVIQCPEFKQISQELLVRIISNDCLNVQSEYVSLRAVLVWIQGDSPNRNHLMEELLRHVRLEVQEIVQSVSLLPPQSVLDSTFRPPSQVDNTHPPPKQIDNTLPPQKQIDNTFVPQSEVDNKILPQKQVENILPPNISIDNSRMLHNEVQGSDTGERNDIATLSQQLSTLTLKQTALSPRLTEVVIAVCRRTQHKHRGKVTDFSNIYFYHSQAIQWDKLTRIPFTEREDYSSAVVNNVLYLCGGQELDVHDINPRGTKVVFNENWAYDPAKDGWEERQVMMFPRYNHSAAAMDGKLYIVGGRTSSKSYSLRADGEAYDPLTNQWTLIASMQCVEGIANAGLASLDGKLYLVGGTYRPFRPSVPYDSYQGAQVYCPKDDTWHELPSLEREITHRRLHLSRGCLMSLDGFLLLLHEHIGLFHYLYNPVSHTMTSLVPAHGGHWFCGFAVLQGQLMCVGGVESTPSLSTDLVHAWDLTVPKMQTAGDSSEEDHAKRQKWLMMPSLPLGQGHDLTCLNMHIHLPRPAARSDS